MEYQKAILVLKNLLERYKLDAEEKEAVTTAIGMLGWGKLSQSRIRSRKARRDDSARW